MRIVEITKYAAKNQVLWLRSIGTAQNVKALRAPSRIILTSNAGVLWEKLLTINLLYFCFGKILFKEYSWGNDLQRR